jgi:hypothetical protein
VRAVSQGGYAAAGTNGHEGGGNGLVAVDDLIGGNENLLVDLHSAKCGGVKGGDVGGTEHGGGEGANSEGALDLA